MLGSTWVMLRMAVTTGLREGLRGVLQRGDGVWNMAHVVLSPSCCKEQLDMERMTEELSTDVA